MIEWDEDWLCWRERSWHIGERPDDYLLQLIILNSLVNKFFFPFINGFSTRDAYFNSLKRYISTIFDKWKWMKIQEWKRELNDRMGWRQTACQFYISKPFLRTKCRGHVRDTEFSRFLFQIKIESQESWMSKWKMLAH